MNPTTGDSVPDAGLDEANSSSNLDHALLESLFYNEMMFLDDSSSTSLFNTLATGTSAPPATDHRTSETVAEKDLLRHFGVNAHQGDASTNEATPAWNEVPHPLTGGNGSVGTALAPTLPPMPPSVASPLAASELSASDSKREKMVSQFATLASRLGIDLPPQLLESLGGSSTGQQASILAALHNLNAASAGSDPSAASTTTMDPAAQEKLQQIQSAAAEAIAAATTKRSRSTDTDDPVDPTSADQPSKPYSKRRKKPRLSDCEQKLQEVQAENEMLKRHLTNISEQSAKVDQGRAETERKMREMAETDADSEQLAAVVQEYIEMYSDYGRKRHREMTFHLEQLQRLANPTNFTKMGLWTLAQQSKDPKQKINPLASILQNELEITSQQARKIFDQQQKIRDVCSNLKECLALLAKLKGLCEQKTKTFHDRMTKCREILTPLQVVKLIMWIDQHSPVLEQVCPGWTSEQVQRIEPRKS